MAGGVLIALLTGAAAPAAGQDDGAPRALRLGAVQVIPRITLSNLGLDSNVFNEPVDPKQDTSFVLTPAIDLRMRLSRGQLTATSVPSFGYYHRYANQRTRNFSQTVAFQWPFNRVLLRASAVATEARERPGLEINERVHRSQRDVVVGADLRVASKTTLRVDLLSAAVGFDEAARVEGTSLASALNRRGDAVSLSLRYARTPLTTVVVLGEWLRDEFARTPQRNAHGFRLAPGVEFARTALISGAAYVGFRSLTPSQAGVPAFRGLVANLGLASVIRTRTRLSVAFARDLTYSYDLARPYFVQSGVTVGVTERIGSRWDVVASLSRQRMTYRTLATTPVASTRPERFSGGGVGVGYHLARGMRIGVDARGVRRESAEPGHSYTSWQIGNSVSYEF